MVARDGGRIAAMLGGAVAEWKRIVTDSGDLVARVEKGLRRN